MIKVLLVVGLGLMANVSFSSNLGHYGQVFPVLEEDIRQVIMRRLHLMEVSGELERREHEVQARVSEHIVRPTPLNLPTTTAPKTFHVDPTVLVNHDIWTTEGVQVAKAGTKLNPFDAVKFSKTLFFFDADDKKQVAWVKKHYQDYSHVKFILTGGDIRDAADTFGRIYFDLGGRLASLLKLKHVPSVVNQDGRLWKIQEVGANDA